MSAEAGSLQVGRLVQAVDFERVLRHRSRVQSVHFALHHVAGLPAPKAAPAGPRSTELSTDTAALAEQAVDDLPFPALVERHAIPVAARLSRLWLGAVVPKRHARRAVTRTLLKRQIRAAVVAHAGALDPGLWVVRLRAGFDRAAFPSAASTALQRAARDELDSLLVRCGASAAASA